MRMPETARFFFPIPRREWLFHKLERVMEAVDRGGLPMVIKEVYLFGGFLRDKERPTDVDVLLIYDSDRTLHMYERTDRDGRPRWCFCDIRTSPSRLRAALKKNAEKTVDINICPSVEEFERDLSYQMDVLLKIWSEEDKDWRSKLAWYFELNRLVVRPRPLPISPRARSASRCRSPRIHDGSARSGPGLSRSARGRRRSR